MTDSGDHKGRGEVAGPAAPVGNLVGMSRWPLALAAVGWVAWVGFLVLMAVGRQANPPT